MQKGMSPCSTVDNLWHSRDSIYLNKLLEAKNSAKGHDIEGNG